MAKAKRKATGSNVLPNGMKRIEGIPDFLRLSPEQRAESWIKNPPKQWTWARNKTTGD